MQKRRAWRPKTKTDTMEFAAAPKHYPHGIRYTNPDGSFRYVRDTDKLSYEFMRKLFAFCYLTIRRGTANDMFYRDRGTLIRSSTVWSLLKSSGADDEFIESTQKALESNNLAKSRGGMHSGLLFVYACMCNFREHWGVVFPEHIAYEILYEDFTRADYNFDALAAKIYYFFPNFYGNNLVFEEGTMRPLKNPNLDAVGNRFVSTPFERRPYYPRYFVFFAPNKERNHAFIIACYPNGYSKETNMHYYKVQIMDSGAYVNAQTVNVDGTDREVLTNKYAKKVASRLNILFEFLGYKHICFQPESFKKFFIKKARNGENNCGFFSCYHARYFVDGVPLFLGNNDIFMARTVINWELHHGLIVYDSFNNDNDRKLVELSLQRWNVLDRSLWPSIERYSNPAERERYQRLYKNSGLYIHPRHSYITPYSRDFHRALSRTPEEAAADVP